MVYLARLESVCAGNRTEGSNPSLSAIYAEHEILYRYLIQNDPVGEVREWFNRAVSKTVVPSGTEGSNPSLSAILEIVRCKKIADLFAR